MITIDLGTLESYNSETQQFEYEEGGIVHFEHSLKAMYLWEGKWGKSFLKGDYTDVELIDYYKMMALQPLDDRFITHELTDVLGKYISNSNTATTFTSSNGSANTPSRPKVYTAEEIYALMFMSHIPLEFENRNLNRLLVILRIISSYNSPPKKMSKADILKQNKELNAQRKAQMKTKG